MLRALLIGLCVLIVAPAAARAQIAPPYRLSFPDQRPAGPELAPLLQSAEAYWHAQGVEPCGAARPDFRTLTVWAAPALPYDDGVLPAGRGWAVTCELWLTDETVRDALHPAELDRAVMACFVIFHEIGHADGLPHGWAAGTPVGDLMSGSPDNIPGRAPEECWQHARATFVPPPPVTPSAPVVAAPRAPAAPRVRVKTYLRAPRWP